MECGPANARCSGHATPLGPRATDWFSVGYLLQQKPKDAITAYSQSLRLKPDYAEAYNNRGAAKDALGRHDDALADYAEAIRLKPDLAEAYGNRGNAKNALGLRGRGRKDFETTLELARNASNAGMVAQAEQSL